MTGTLVVTFRVNPARNPALYGNISASMSELAPRDGRTPPRTAALSFRDERARVE